MGNQELITQSDYIIAFGTLLSCDNEEINEAVVTAIANNNAEFIYMHPIDDIDLKVYYSQFIKYEVGSEEGIATLLVDAFVKSSNDTIQNFINDLDIGYISAESSAGEEEFEEAYEKSLGKTNKTLIIGDDIFTHECAESILKLLTILKEFAGFELVILNEKYRNAFDAISCESIEEVEDLKSYNGTLLYRYNKQDSDNSLVGSNSFARVAKVSDGDAIFINYGSEKIEKLFKVDENLQGTIALCAMGENDNSAIFDGYRYKQVKIEKVDA